MKKGWTTKRIGELCEFQRGLTYAKGDEVESSKNVVLRANNVDLVTNRLDFSELKYISDKVAVPSSKLVRPNSLLICTASGSKSHLGKVAFIDDDYGYAFGGFMGQLTPGQTLIPKFLFHMMTSEAYKEFIAALSDGANINNLKFDDLGKFAVPVPPLSEQQRIVGVLDEAFAGLATAQAHAAQNLQNARALFESHLQSVFTHRGKGWVEKRLGEVYEFKNGMNFDKTQKAERGTPTIDVLNMYGDSLEVRLGNLYRITKPVPADYLLTEGDILVVRSSVKREGVGWPALFRSSAEPTTFCGFIIRGRPVVEVRPEYVVYFLRCRTTREQLVSSAKQATITNINQGTLGALHIPLPSLADQRAVATQLDALAAETQRLTRLYEQKQAALAALKKSLLHQAFTGEL